MLPRNESGGRVAALLLALPFLVCFSGFGAVNVAGGVALTMLSRDSAAFAARHRMLGDQDDINVMQIVGIILLVTGFLLILIGITLCVIALRSTDDVRSRRRQALLNSNLAYGSNVCCRRTSTASIMSTSCRSRNGAAGRRSPDKTFTPIPEVNSEEERVQEELTEVYEPRQTLELTDLKRLAGPTRFLHVADVLELPSSRSGSPATDPVMRTISETVFRTCELAETSFSCPQITVMKYVDHSDSESEDGEIVQVTCESAKMPLIDT